MIDFLISLLDRSYWALLSVWLLLLAGAFVVTFPEASLSAASKLARARQRARLL